jgi:hypothetical protein
MNSTIFCTFEQQDFADLAAGRLKAPELGVRSIHYVAGYRNPGFTSSVEEALERPVTMRIVCAENTAAAVKARLVNLHGYQIITG